MSSFLRDYIDNPKLWTAGSFCLPIAYVLIYSNWVADLETATVPTTQVETTLPGPKAPDLVKIASLFGESIKNEPEEANAKESSLSLKLVASYVTGTDGLSGAVIENNGDSQRLYFQGDLVMPGVKLISVHPRRVLIKRNEVIEKITLQERPGLSTQASNSSSYNSSQQLTASQVSNSGESIVDGHEQLMEKLAKLRSASKDNN